MAVLRSGKITAPRPRATPSTNLLFKLPPELRNLVYEHFFTEFEVEFSEPATGDIMARRPGLLDSNRVIRHEVKGMYISRLEQEYVKIWEEVRERHSKWQRLLCQKKKRAFEAREDFEDAKERQEAMRDLLERDKIVLGFVKIVTASEICRKKT